MTAKTDETTKLVQRIITSVASVACLFILNSMRSDVNAMKANQERFQQMQYTDHTEFRIGIAVNKAELNDHETRIRSNESEIQRYLKNQTP